MGGVALAAVWGSSGCVNLNKEVPVKTAYSLDVLRQGSDPVAQTKSVLEIRKFRVAPPFEGRGLVYRMGEQRYESDYYHEWFISPNAMVTQQVQNWLTAASLFEHVLASGSTAEETHLLEGTVTALYGDFRDPAALKAVLGIQIVLLDAGSLDSGILFQRDYRREIALAVPTPDVLVKGWNDTLREILTAAEEDLAKVLPRPSTGQPWAGRKGSASDQAPAKAGE